MAMSLKGTTFPGMEDLLEVLLRQYVLHEGRHHPPLFTQPDNPLKVRTIAHDMPDTYRCLHQGTFGHCNHIPSPEHLRKHLTDDYYKVEADDSGPVLESVTPDNSILMVNLRPYEVLFPGEEEKAFFMLERLVLDSSLGEKGSPEKLFNALMVFMELNQCAFKQVTF